MQLSELIKSRIDLYGLSFGLGKKCRKRVNRKTPRVAKTGNHKIAFGQVKPQQVLPKWSKGRRKTRSQSNKTKAQQKKMKRKVKRKATNRQRK